MITIPASSITNSYTAVLHHPTGNYLKDVYVLCYGLVNRIGSPLYVQGVTYIYMAVSTSMIATIAIIHQSFGPDGVAV